MIRISIVTLSYNQIEFLEEALKSVLDQDYPNVEYIVVDPGSHDGSRAVIEQYRGRIAHVLTGPDKGPAHGLNRGFAVATGDVFGYLNADDRLLPGALTRVAREFEADPALEILSGHMRIINASGDVLRRSFTDRFSVHGLAYGTWNICQQSTFFRSATFRDAGAFDISNVACWDRDLMARMFATAPSHKIIDILLSDFRVYNQSITGSKKFAAAERAIMNAHFRHFMHRDPNRLDSVARLFWMGIKYAREPRSLLERLSKGTIFKPKKGIWRKH